MKISARFRGIVVLAALGACQGVSAQLVLVTEQEAEASRSAPPQFTPKALPAVDAPRIILEAPDISHPLAPPIRISLRFRPAAPAVIRPETFRVYYGAFALDITRRITESARVAPEGLQVSGAILPKGLHSLQVELEDSLGRHGRQRFEFVVE
jgi:hypothetical protein